VVGIGVCISILPQVARDPADTQSLVYIELSGGSPSRELAIIRHQQRYQSRGAEQFLAVLRERADELMR
jgi:LysR family hydrogen peroxide-inducible transcriptional activator